MIYGVTRFTEVSGLMHAPYSCEIGACIINSSKRLRKVAVTEKLSGISSASSGKP